MARNADSAPGDPAASALRLARPRHLTGLVVPATAATVTDQQIRALVGAASALAERQRAHGLDSSSAAAQERLACLDWAVTAGGRALGDRAQHVEAASGASALHGTGTRR